MKTNKYSVDIKRGKRVVQIEAKALLDLEKKIDKNFAKAVETIFNCKGRVIITGTGKSGLIARKIVATLNSTGTPALFLHPTDAVHGDLGMVKREDVAILISKSGDTQELRPLVPIFKVTKIKIISILGKLNSYLAKSSDIVLDATVKEEACPHDLAPTTSTTVALAFGDALAIALLEKRNFTAEDFALFHPGGMLGKKLNSTLKEFMVSGKDLPCVKENISLHDTILEITSKRLGATCVVNNREIISGIVTDGDLRRLLQGGKGLKNICARDIMSKNPKTVLSNTLAVVGLEIMESFSITQLIVVDGKRNQLGWYIYTI